MRIWIVREVEFDEEIGISFHDKTKLFSDRWIATEYINALYAMMRGLDSNLKKPVKK